MKTMDRNRKYRGMCRMLLLGLLCLASSCNNELLPIIEPEENPNTTSITLKAMVDADTQDGALTRAGGDENIPTGYQLRCILEVYADGVNNPVARYEKYESNADYAFGQPFAFDNVRLPAGNTYMAVCWADYIKTDNDGDVFYNTTNGLTAVVQKAESSINASTLATTAAGDDAEDAYTGMSASFTIAADGSMSGEDQAKLWGITLRRPFAKLVLPWVKLCDNSGSAYPSQQTVRINYVSGTVYTTYNAKTGEVSGSKTTSYPRTISSFTNSFELYQYLFIPATLTDAIELEFNITGENGGTTTFKHGDTPANIKLSLTKPANYVLTVKGATENSGEYPLIFKAIP